MSSDIRTPGAAEWGKAQLVSLLSEKPRNGLYKGAEYQGVGSRWVKMKDIYGNDFIRNQQMSLIEVSQSEAERFGCEDGDLLFGRTSLTLEGIGDCALVCEPCDRPIFESNLFRIRFDHVVAVPRFFYYFFKSFQGKELIQSIAKQTAATSITASDLIRLDVPCPDLASQHGICDFLESLDDRITLLRETNTTLEAIAQALFKSWFVDFDPVRAKAEGRQPECMDDPAAALFPDSFEESELGLVPKGWVIKTLQDLLVLQRGFDLPASTRTAGAYPIIAASGPSGTHHEAMAKGPGVVTGRSGILGRVFLELEDYWPLNTTLWVKEFRAATPCYAYELLRLIDFASFNAGSAVPSLNRNHVHGLKYLIPDNACIEAFEAIALPIHQRAQANEKQAQTLTQLRDTLLPRLISGQLRLPEAETLLEGAL